MNGKRDRNWKTPGPPKSIQWTEDWFPIEETIDEAMAHYEYNCMVCGKALEYDAGTHSYGHLTPEDHTPSASYRVPGLSPPCKNIHIRHFDTDISGEIKTKYMSRKPRPCSECKQQDERCSYEIRECRICGMVIWREKGEQWKHWHQTKTNFEFDHEATITKPTREEVDLLKAKYWAISKAWSNGEYGLVKALYGCKPEAFKT